MIFRIDDIGASSKHFNQHGKKTFRLQGIPVFYFPLANFWFLKRIWPFKKGGKYEELTEEEWKKFLNLFEKYNIVPIVSITACWVEKDSKLVPFPEKFKEESAVFKKAFIQGKIIVANHGLTHCVVGKQNPSFFTSNRKFHREFWPFLEEKVHFSHILKSQEILEKFFERPIEIFVPPGNVWSYKTYMALKKTNIKKVLAERYMMDSKEKMEGIEFIDNSFVIHDRDLKLKGAKWLENVLKRITK